MSLSGGLRQLIAEDDIDDEDTQHLNKLSILKDSTIDHVDENDLIPTGTVVGVLQSPTADREVVAFMPLPRLSSLAADTPTVAQSSSGREDNVLVIPADRSLPRFRVTTRQKSWLQGKKVVIRMSGWSSDSDFPAAHIVRCLGGTSDFAAEMNAILLEHSIYNRPFSIKALACLPEVLSSRTSPLEAVTAKDLSSMVEVDCSNPNPSSSRRPWVDSRWKVPMEAMAGRRDFRHSRSIFRFEDFLLYYDFC